MEKKPKNITFSYVGLTQAGQKIAGELHAPSLALAKVNLSKQGIVINNIVKKRLNRNKKITSSEMTIFSRQLATMIDAGIALVQALDFIAKSQSNPSLKDLIGWIKCDVETGLTLSESLIKHPAYFNHLFCNLVEAGEKSGSLEILLHQIAGYKEKVESLKKTTKKTLTYPIAVLIMTLLITSGLLFFVIPQFDALFKSFGAELPIATKIITQTARFFQSFWYVIFGLVTGIIYAFIYAKKHSKNFAQYIDYILLKSPIIGPIIEKASVARFSRTLSITFTAGLPLVDALKSVIGLTGNIIFSKATEQIKRDVSIGIPINKAMESTKLFPNMVVQMVAVGEESGNLEKMLNKIADFYEEEVNNAVDSLSSLLEPIIMSILGILVGGLVISMYLPIFRLGSAM